jgi:hypothetical protein
MANRIVSISAATILAIKQKSAMFLPDRPSEAGLSPTTIKHAFSGLVVDSTVSMIAEVNRILGELETFIGCNILGLFDNLPADVSDYQTNDVVMKIDGTLHKLNSGGAWVQVVTTNETNIGTLQSEMATAQQDIIDAVARIGVNEGDILALQEAFGVNLTEDIIPTIISSVDAIHNVGSSGLLDVHTANTNNPHTVTKTQLELGNVDNTSDVNKPISTLQQAGLDLKENVADKGAAGGYCPLGEDTLVPQAYLPSYVDDILEYTDLASFPVTGETGKIYVDKTTNKTYRWSGSAYVVISETLALGETSATAYRGDKGKTAYDHSQLSSGNPHSVSKSDVGLGDVDNTSDEDKPISTLQQGALDLKVNIADLDVVYSTDIDRIGYFTLKENNVVSTTISQLALDILTCVASYQRPLMVGVRNGYDGGKQLTISDAPILSSSPLVNLNTTFDGYGIVYGIDRVEFYLHPYAIQSVASYKTAVFYGIYKPTDGVNPPEFSGWKQITYKEYVDTIESEKEDVANKITTWQETSDDTHYPSEKLVDDRIAPIEANVEVLQLDNVTKSKQILDIEENLRKTMANEVTGTVSGTDIISLGKDVANAPLKVEVDGGLLYAPQLVTNGDFSDGTTGWTGASSTLNVLGGIGSMIGNGTSPGPFLTNSLSMIVSHKYYVSLKARATNNLATDLSIRHSGSSVFASQVNPVQNTWYNLSAVITASVTTYRIYTVYNTMADATNAVTEIDYAYSFNISTLIANKQYSPLYEDTFDNLTDEQIKTQMDLWVNNKTLPNANLLATSFDKRIRSVGKNLFDNSRANLDKELDETDGTLMTEVGRFVSDYIKVKPSTAYKSTGYVVRILFYDINKIFISGLLVVDTNYGFTTPSTAYYVRFSTTPTTTYLNTFQLELGSTATAYEPYVSTTMLLNGDVGYRLPNGVKDEVITRDGKMYRVKRINSVAVVGVVSVNTTNYPLAKNGGQFINYLTAGGSEIGVIGTNSTSGDGFMLYELATPIPTEILALGNLIGYENGTVYIDDIMQDADIYGTNATITNTDYPIKTLESVIKINADGSQTALAVSGATVASGGLSFTHALLTSGDKVWFSYIIDGDYFNSTSTITYYDNKNVVSGSGTTAGKIYKLVPTIVDENIVWTKVEV